LKTKQADDGGVYSVVQVMWKESAFPHAEALTAAGTGKLLLLLLVPLLAIILFLIFINPAIFCRCYYYYINMKSLTRP